MPYKIIAASSESDDTRVSELENAAMKIFEPYEAVRSGGWECSRYCEWPQEFLIRLDVRSQLKHIIIIPKKDRDIPSCEFYIGDGGATSTFTDCDYRLAGSHGLIGGTTPTQISLTGIGIYLKIVFKQAPRRTDLNLHQQVGIGFLKIFAQPMEMYKGIVNHEYPVLNS